MLPVPGLAHGSVSTPVPPASAKHRKQIGSFMDPTCNQAEWGGLAESPSASLTAYFFMEILIKINQGDALHLLPGSGVQQRRWQLAQRPRFRAPG